MGEHVIEVLSAVQPVITEIERPFHFRMTQLTGGPAFDFAGITKRMGGARKCLRMWVNSVAPY
jgi:hypothetical protein